MIVGLIFYVLLAGVFIKLYKEMEQPWCLWMLLLMALSFFGTTPIYGELPFNGRMFITAASLLLGIYILVLISRGVSEEKREYRRKRRIERRRKYEEKTTQETPQETKKYKTVYSHIPVIKKAVRSRKVSS